MRKLIVMGDRTIHIPEDTYQATCKGVSYNHSLSEERIRFVFKLHDKRLDLSNNEIVAYALAEPFLRTMKACRWISRLLEREFEPGDIVDPAECKGRPCRVVVRGAESTRNGKMFSKVVDLLPADDLEEDLDGESYEDEDRDMDWPKQVLMQ